MNTLPAWKRPLVPLARLIVRWVEWDGHCGKPLDVTLFGLPWNCANPVGRIAYALFGRCLRRH